MRRIISLVLAVVMAFGSFSFAAPTTAGADYKAVGNELKVLGVIAGQDGGELNEFGKLTREQALVVLSRMMGKEAEAKATTAESGYTDVPAKNFYAPYVAYAKLQGWTNGISQTEFGFEKPATTKMVVTFMMRALGYNVDWSKEDVMAKARTMGLLKDVSVAADDEIIRGEVFVLLRNTLETNPNGEKRALKYVLGLTGATSAATLEVESVYANNLKQITVVFNQEVDKDTLDGSFVVKGGTTGAIEEELLADGKTVVLDLENKMVNRRGYSIVISKVKTPSKLEVAKVTKQFRTEDLEVPEITAIEVTGPREFRVIFSEPINFDDAKSTKSVKYALAGKRLRNATAIPSKSENNVVEVTGIPFKDGQTYDVLVSGYRDYAGYSNLDKIKHIEYSNVTDAPTATVTRATQKYVVVEFNRPVKGLKAENFYHTYSAWKALGIYNKKTDMDKRQNPVRSYDKVTKVYVEFARTVETKKSNYPLPEGTVRLAILGQVGSLKVQDNWKNQLQDTTAELEITADREAPVVELVEATGEKEITVTFSKDVEEKSATRRANYEVLNSDGSKLSGVYYSAKAESSKKVKLRFTGKSLVGKSVTLNIKDVRDTTLYKNKMVGVSSHEVSFTDKTFKGIDYATKTVKKGVVTLNIVFDEAVNAATAEEIKNYRFSTTTSTTTVSIANAKFEAYNEGNVTMITDKIARIEFPAKYAGKNGLAGIRMVQISDKITDLAGNSVDAFSNTSDVRLQAPDYYLKKAVATDKSHITLTLDQDVEVRNDQELKGKWFKVFAGATEYTVEVVELTDSQDKLVLTLKDSAKLPADAANLKVELVKDIFTTTLEGKLDAARKTVSVKDEIKPQFITRAVEMAGTRVDVSRKYAILSSTSTSGIYNLTLEFDEEMNKESFSKNTFNLYGSADQVEILSIDKDSVARTVIYTIKVKDEEVKALNLITTKVGNAAGVANLRDIDWTVAPARENTVFDRANNALVGTDAIPVYLQR